MNPAQFVSSQRLCLLALLAVMLFLPIAQAQTQSPTGKPELWFVGRDDLETNGKVDHPDYAKLFVPGSPWQTGMQHVDVMEVRPPWILRTNKDEVKQVFDFMAQHHIKVAAVTGTVITEGCGLGIEGFGSAKQTEAYPRAMKQMGVPLDYIIVDEPFTWGHGYSGKNACNFSVEETVKRTAQSIRLVQKYYPDAKIALTEVPQAFKGGPQEMLEFLRLWKNELGQFPSSVTFDMQWSTPWQSDTPGFVNMLTAQHIPYGVIWDGTIPRAQTSKEFIDSAKVAQQQFRALIKQPPSVNVIQSWSPQPDRNLPENDPNTMTGYLKWFVTTHDVR